MKRFYFALLSAAVLLTASCQKSDVVAPTTDGYSFNSSIVAAATRATASNFESGDQIGVSAFSDAALSSATAENVLYTYNGSSFTSTTPIAYTEGVSAAFRAIYPYAADMATTYTFDIESDQSVSGAYTASDLMVAATELTDSAVPALSFNHMLSQINVSLTSEIGSIASAVVKVATATSVSCDFAAETFEGTGSVGEVTATPNGTNYYSAIVAPQTLTAGTTLVTVTVAGEDYTAVLTSDLTLASGVSYLYEATITSDGELEFSTLIDDWGEMETIIIDEEEPGDGLAQGWLGTWDLTATLSDTGSEYTISIVITEGTMGTDYDVWGLDLSTGRGMFAMPAYASTDGGFTVLGENTVGSYSYYTAMWLGYAYIGGSYNANYIITGSYDAMVASLGADGVSASAVGGSGTISDGTAFETSAVRLFFYYGGSYYNFYNDTDTFAGISDDDYLTYPYTFVKTSDSTAVTFSTSATDVTKGIFMSPVVREAIKF